MNGLGFRRILIVALAALVAGCDAGGEAGEEASESRQDAPERVPVEVEVELELGQVDGDGPELFGEIRAIEIGSDDRLLVFDHFANELRMFSSTGEHLGSVGRTGAGPEEFQGVVGMAVAPNGDVWIIDGANDRYTIVSDDETERTMGRPSRVVRRPWIGGFDVEGDFHDLATDPEGGALEDALLEVGEDGSVVARFPIPGISVPTPTIGGGVMVSIPFAPEVLRTWDPAGGVWQGVSSEYRITRVGLQGDTIATIERDVEPAPFNSSEADSLEAAVEGAEDQFGADVESEMRPSGVPPLRWFVTDDEGRLWVCASGRDPCTELDVFTAAGAALGTVSLPSPVEGSPGPRIRGDRFLAVTRGELGEPRILFGRVVFQ